MPVVGSPQMECLICRTSMNSREISLEVAFADVLTDLVLGHGGASSTLRLQDALSHSHRASEAVSKLDFLFMFFFVLVRVISWIVRYAAKKERSTKSHEPSRNAATCRSDVKFEF